MAEIIRRCRPLLRRAHDHEGDAIDLAVRLNESKVLATDDGLVSYALARFVIRETLADLVDTGLAVRVDDPDGGPALYGMNPGA